MHARATIKTALDFFISCRLLSAKFKPSYQTRHENNEDKIDSLAFAKYINNDLEMYTEAKVW